MIVAQAYFRDTVDELRPLFQKHWDEVGMAGTDKLKHEFKLNEVLFHLLEDMENTLFIKAVNDEGKIIGYMAILMSQSVMMEGYRFATCEAIYVLPEYRPTLVANKMINLAEKLLKHTKGVSLFQIAFDWNHDLSSLLKVLKFNPTCKVFCKELV